MPGGHPDKALEIGAEDTPEQFVARLVDVFREVRRVLHPSGTLWLNIGDSYAGYWGDAKARVEGRPSSADTNGWTRGFSMNSRPQFDNLRRSGLKPKDLIGIPWLLAFALRADGWWLRSEIIWCLSGGTWVYAKTQKGVMPIMIRDLARLNPATVQLWNGEKWTRLLGMSKSARRGDELELVLRSGERISCTPTHKFPTGRGLLHASEIQVGDVIEHCRLPEPETPLSPEHLTEEAAWFAGLYIAEGNRDDKTIQIAGHVREVERFERVQHIAEAYGGSATVRIHGNNMTIRVYGRMLHAILDTLVSGEGAKKKGFSPVAWRYSNNFLSSMLDGYLSGDGHWDAPNKRWRLGFTRNYNLERDLRTVCARLGLHLTLKMTHTSYDGGTVPTFRGEIRMERSGHFNEKGMGEVVEIRKARCREVYDLGVEDEPHLFSLASGILTHNSKKAPMPESVTDRPTKAHEQVFLLAKNATYFYDATAIREPNTSGTIARLASGAVQAISKHGKWQAVNGARDNDNFDYGEANGRNKRSVWTLGPESYDGAHFATFPTKLVEPCVLAGTSQYGACEKCLAPYERVVERESTGRATTASRLEDGIHERSSAKSLATKRQAYRAMGLEGPPAAQTTGWTATCTCNAGVIPCTVLDPFMGSGTTLAVALKHGRRAIGIDLDERNLALARTRIERMQPVLLEVTP